MSRLWTENEPIEVTLNDRGWPEHFVWLGQRCVVRGVNARWTVETDWWSEQGEVHREYLKLTVWNERTRNEMLCEVYLDLVAEDWFLSCVYD